MKKLYYSIGEVARMTGLEAHVLRYWESVFPMLRPSKSRSGTRRYKEQDLRMVLLIQDLVHRRRYSTAGALKVLREQAEPSSARQADMFAPGRPQETPTTSPPDQSWPVPSRPAPSMPAEIRRSDNDPGRLTPQMRLELLTIRELLKQLRDLL
jgi:DNA-binding transcriptional MerR regulator